MKKKVFFIVRFLRLNIGNVNYHSRMLKYKHFFDFLFYFHKIGFLINSEMKISLFFLFISSICLSQEILWQQAVGGESSDYLNQIINSPDNGFLIGGSSFSKKSGNKKEDSFGSLDLFLWKMNEYGNEEWQVSFGSKDNDYFSSLSATYDGGYLIGGNIEFVNSNDSPNISDCVIIKLDPFGKKQWSINLKGNKADFLEKAFQTRDKGFLICCSSSSDPYKDPSSKQSLKDQKSKGNLDIWLIKLDENGKVEWNKTIGGKGVDRAVDVIELNDGYLVGTTSESDISGDKKTEKIGFSDYWLLKIDHNGNVIWQNSYGGENRNKLTQIISHDKEIWLLGDYNEQIKGEWGWSYQLLKLDEFGKVLFNKKYTFAKMNFSKKMIWKDKNLIIAGYTRDEKLMEDGDLKGNDVYRLIKINPNGDIIYNKTLDGGGSDRLKSIALSSDNGIILAGSSNSDDNKDKSVKSFGRDDFWIVKLKDTSNATIKANGINIYPNPAKEYVNILIKDSFKEANIKFFDLNGSLVLTKKSKRKLTPIEINSLQTGVYVIEASVDGKIYNQKLIVK
ncbi:T9SS type A sorting domain-containing protein [Ornithobacterium rhinotracheale]|uniref:T9SS type A sorting domain-containing protein n=1 Tax=Ornithobacterium rhinotracheale TaxID=28251 RepID=UPI0040359A45